MGTVDTNGRKQWNAIDQPEEYVGVQNRRRRTVDLQARSSNGSQHRRHVHSIDDAEWALRDARVRAVERADHLVTVLGFATR